MRRERHAGRRARGTIVTGLLILVLAVAGFATPALAHHRHPHHHHRHHRHHHVHHHHRGSGPGGGTGGRATGGSAHGPLVPPQDRTYFGAYAPPSASNWTEAGQKHAVTGMESELGRRLDISNHYYPFNKPLSDWRESWDLRDGRIPMISWDGTKSSAILSGAEDPIIDRMADSIRNLGGEVFLRFFWEMDGNKKASMAQSPAKFKAAWRYIHDVFAERGATNVAWVWCPNAYSFSLGSAMRWYPGDAYVDWAGADGYNWGKVARGGTWQSFGSIFQSFYRKMGGRKPLMVGETGSVSRGGNKAKWIRKAAATMRDQMPDIRAFVWFNSVDGSYDWRVTSGKGTLQAYRAVGQESYFNP